MKNNIMIDGRTIFEHEKMLKAGFRHYPVGIGEKDSHTQAPAYAEKSFKGLKYKNLKAFPAAL